MPRRAVAVVLAVLLSLSGCKVRTVQQVPAASLPPLSGQQTIVRVTTIKGEDVQFDPPGATIKDGTVSGIFKKGPVNVPLDQVQRFWVQTTQVSTARTVGLVAGLTAAVVVIAVVAAVAVGAAKKSTPAATTTTSQGLGSCPFVYSWDGTRYVFEAEPYGGAIARGLEKDDYSELGQLKEEDGRYKLRMTNEVDETQMTNLTELWVVDHPKGTRVVPDIDGKLHTVSAPQNQIGRAHV